MRRSDREVKNFEDILDFLTQMIYNRKSYM